MIWNFSEWQLSAMKMSNTMVVENLGLFIVIPSTICLDSPIALKYFSGRDPLPHYASFLFNLHFFTNSSSKSTSLNFTTFPSLSISHRRLAKKRLKQSSMVAIISSDFSLGISQMHISAAISSTACKAVSIMLLAVCAFSRVTITACK
uniref:Uncharacterized protein n=1 Tax=Glossina palpalis gambiensis TaxID=67801 RepID=A0A1B0AP36_9MUSC